MRLIDADRLKSYIDCWHLRPPTEVCFSEFDVCNMVDKQPTIDAVEVVRCKDCYHAEDDITHMFCVYFGHKVYEDDYCSNAVERREDGEV